MTMLSLRSLLLHRSNTHSRWKLQLVVYRSSHVEFSLAGKQVPSPEEVLQLNHMYCSPQQLVSRILKHVIEVDPHCSPRCEFIPVYNGLLWRVHLHFVWPLCFYTTAVSSDQQRAEHYAYLEACDMFHHIGLVTSSGEIVDCRKIIELSQQRDQIFHGSRLQFDSCVVRTASGRQWSSLLHIGWPYNISSVGRGLTRSAAETVASSMAYVTLKSKKLVDRSNLRVNNVSIVRLPPCARVTDELPDYELWVDASETGFGAYIVCHCNPVEGSSTRWLREPWPSHLYEHCARDLRHYSSFIEFYALVCAVFTWKKKFAGQTVCVWSDSQQSIDLVVKGFNLQIRTRTSSKHILLFAKLFQTLHNTCCHYNIHLYGRHVNRQFNQAADSLAKLKMDRFYEMVPNASPQAKKSKKLLFIAPLTCLVNNSLRQQTCIANSHRRDSVFS